jgi:hypothetical protein
MNQITIRGIPADVERVIRQESKRNNQSLNKTILSMLGNAVTAAPNKGHLKKKELPPSDFSAFSGTWTKEEADEFDARIEEMFEQIDEEMWK